MNIAKNGNDSHSVMQGRLRALLEQRIVSEYITPLFWQHGESREILLEEIERMHSAGMNGFIMEARPFPEFLEEPWWNTVGFALQEAQKRNMKVFVFDDIKFPSGFAAGRIRDSHPEYLKVYLKESHIDCFGPMEGASFRLKTWCEAEEKLVRVIAVPISNDGSSFDAAASIDVTGSVDDNGILYWDVPAGRHRIFMFIRTRDGGEKHTRDYLNPLEHGAVQAYIDAVYEPHYQRFSQYFGNTFAGFFSDEPRFGNAETYEAVLGKRPMVIPFSDRLLDQLSVASGKDFSTMLPCLWYDGGKITADARYCYMNTVSRLYGDNFTKQIGDWCRERQVKYIGHVIEDNGAHTRLGYGTGHFFRAIDGQDWSGLDAVLLQLLPEYTEGICPTPFGPHDSNFFYWGLTKLATSAGHFDPKKNGTTFCESFGAYGWQEGLKLMTWLTNHFCVRGVNHFVPHAFSPQEFPDEDCPPHFYARGFNPQWRYFKTWADYANRICHLLSDGRHISSAAVLYHAEAEWSGMAYDPFENVVKPLAQNQIDCDIIPADLLLDRQRGKNANGKLSINGETFPVILVPFAECLPVPLMERLCELAENQVKIVFMRNLPLLGVDGNDATTVIEKLKKHSNVAVTGYDELPALLQSWDVDEVRCSSPENDLRIYHYEAENQNLYFCVNEGIRKRIFTSVRFRHDAVPVCYDPMQNLMEQPEYRKVSDGVEVSLELAPYETVFVIFGESTGTLAERIAFGKTQTMQEITGPWEIGIASAKEFPHFSTVPEITGPGNISTPECLPQFAGTIRYETEFTWDEVTEKRIFIDLGDVFETAAVEINGQTAGVRIAPPYRMELTGLIHQGINHLRIDVTNTLAKQYGDSIFDRGAQHEPSGLLGPVKIIF